MVSIRGSEPRRPVGGRRLTEQFNVDGEIFGVDRLLDVFRRTEGFPVEETRRAVLEELEAFRGSALVKDDRTLLTLEYDG